MGQVLCLTLVTLIAGRRGAVFAKVARNALVPADRSISTPNKASAQCPDPLLHLPYTGPPWHHKSTEASDDWSMKSQKKVMIGARTKCKNA